MRVLAKKTIDLSNTEKEQLSNLFNEVFNKKNEWSYFEKKYASPVKGYSYHGLLVTEDNIIVGATSLIPLYYSFFGERKIFSESVDTMIKKEFRNNFLYLKKIYTSAKKLSVHEDTCFIYGKPNKYSFPYVTKVIGWKHIGNLNYYFLPLNIPINNIFFCIINFLLKTFSKFLYFAPVLDHYLFNGNNYSILREFNVKYASYRFWNNYKRINYKNNNLYYKLYNENNYRVALILDFMPVKAKWLKLAINKLIKIEKDEVDIILYIGRLNFFVPNLIKIPKFKIPISVPLTGEIINPTLIDDRVYNLKFWHINMADFDVR